MLAIQIWGMAIGSVVIIGLMTPMVMIGVNIVREGRAQDRQTYGADYKEGWGC